MSRYKSEDHKWLWHQVNSLSAMVKYGEWWALKEQSSEEYKQGYFEFQEAIEKFNSLTRNEARRVDEEGS